MACSADSVRPLCRPGWRSQGDYRSRQGVHRHLEQRCQARQAFARGGTRRIVRADDDPELFEQFRRCAACGIMTAKASSARSGTICNTKNCSHTMYLKPSTDEPITSRRAIDTD